MHTLYSYTLSLLLYQSSWTRHISANGISTADQLTNHFTKGLTEDIFVKGRKELMKWYNLGNKGELGYQTRLAGLTMINHIT